MAVKQNHYEALEISKDAELIDIKKAYRRLALKHHPDRNNGSAKSTEKFKVISQAYTILSDTTSRKNYDATLKCPSMSVSAAKSSSSPERYPASPTGSDPFKQFNDLFRNDPFFHGAFQDMDDAFARRFDNQAEDYSQNRDDANTAASSRIDEKNATNGACDAVSPLIFCGMPPLPGIMTKKETPKKNKEPWGTWLMNKLGIELSIESVEHNADGTVKASSYSSKPGTYTNKKSRTYVDKNGQRVSVMSMEKNGNTIEDKFIGGELSERRVNGKIEQLPKQVAN